MQLRIYPFGSLSLSRFFARNLSLAYNFFINKFFFNDLIFIQWFCTCILPNAMCSGSYLYNAYIPVTYSIKCQFWFGCQTYYYILYAISVILTHKHIRHTLSSRAVHIIIIQRNVNETKQHFFSSFQCAYSVYTLERK